MEEGLRLPAEPLRGSGDLGALDRELAQFAKLIDQRREQLKCLWVEQVFKDHPHLLEARLYPKAPGGGVPLPMLSWSPGEEPPRGVERDLKIKLASIGFANTLVVARPGEALEAVARALDPEDRWASGWLARLEAQQMDQASLGAPAAAKSRL